MEVKQISVFVDNKPGKLAELTRLLSDNQINLRAINIAESSDYGVVRLIADQPESAVEVLRSKDYIATLTPVIIAGVPDRPGGLAELVQCFSEEKINIEYMYSIFGQAQGVAYMVIRVDHIPEAQESLKKHGIQLPEITELDINS